MTSIADVLEGRWLRLAQAQAARFWSKVDKSGECWLWTAGKDKDGYGKFALTLPRGQGPIQKHVRAHRIAWALANSAWFPGGAVTRHSCHNRACVRPEHVQPGTQRENIQDEIEAGTFVRGSRNGHASIDEAGATRIRALLASGERKARVAALMGVTRSVVYGIADGKTWRHVP